MSIAENLLTIKNALPEGVELIAVSKTKSEAEIMEAYNAGQRIFGENRVQELIAKHKALPEDIQWHLIGHLQTNKIKIVLPCVKMIHSVDSVNLLKEIDKEAKKIGRVVDCLLEVRIAKEETKYGLSAVGAENILRSPDLEELKNVRICGLMGIATLTDDENEIRREFKGLQHLYQNFAFSFPDFNVLSMGMSSDYKIAIEEGSTLIRVGSSIFGTR